MELLLKQSVEHLGRVGDVVKVKNGYARNFLLPRKLAVVATGGNIKQIEHERRIALAHAEKLRKVAQGAAAQIEGLTIEITMKAGEGDKLYGSVTSRDVADALAARGIEADRKKLELSETIKTLGAHPVTLKLGHELTANFTVVVVAEA